MVSDEPSAAADAQGVAAVPSAADMLKLKLKLKLSVEAAAQAKQV